MPKPSVSHPDHPPLGRLANRIHTQILAARQEPDASFGYALGQLESDACQIVSIHHRLTLCRQHHLSLARTKVYEELADLLRLLPGIVEQLSPLIPQNSDILPVAELVKELEHLEDEFPQWRYDPKAGELIVVTEPITLEEMNFGPFEIRLAIDHLGEGGGRARHGSYKVVALEPRPASSNEAVTHPHVSDEQLCEGDATTPLRAALAEGRIGDFFILVKCVLETYNSASPYVALDQWEGYSCHECGSTTSEDDTYYCEGCDHDYCSECTSYCRCCDNSRCGSCLENCPSCGKRICSECLLTCDECESRCCKSCLKEIGRAHV